MVLCVLAVGINQVEAEIEINEMNVYPDRGIFLTGSVPKTGDWITMHYQIENEEGKTIIDRSVIGGPEGNFTIRHDFSELNGYGIYEVNLSYLDDSETISFEMIPIEIREDVERSEEIICEDGDKVENGACVKIIPNTVDTETHLRSQVAELEQRIVTLENEKSLLEKTNDELQNQLNNVQKQLENANAIIQTQLTVIMDTLANFKLN